jgi:hypothetical protein
VVHLRVTSGIGRGQGWGDPMSFLFCDSCSSCFSSCMTDLGVRLRRWETRGDVDVGGVSEGDKVSTQRVTG